MIQNVVDILEESRKYGQSNSKNILGMLTTLEQSMEGDYLDDLTAAAQNLRNSGATMVSGGQAQALLLPLLRQMCKTVIGRGDLNSIPSMMFEWYKYSFDNGQRVNSRVITYGSPATSGTVVGNGQIVRLTRDAYNFAIESVAIEQKRALCVADYQNGTNRGNEVFQLVGQTPSRDELQRSGSGAEGILVGKTTDDSLLFNASWSQFGGTAAEPNAITNWTSLTLAGAALTVNSTTYNFDSTNYFRAAPSDGSTAYALNIKASALLRQKLSVRGTKLDPNKPYLLAVVWNRAVGSASGTLLLRMGAANASVSVAAQTGWIVTLVPGATLGQSNWYRQFARDDMEIDISWTRTGGSLLVDDVLFLEGTQYEGTFYWALPASATTYTPWRLNDTYTWTDTTATDSKIQRWLHRAGLGYQPHSSGSSVTLADP
jgi:hypothetical protein